MQIYKEGDCIQHDPSLFVTDNDWSWKSIKKILDERTALRLEVKELKKRLNKIEKNT